MNSEFSLSSIKERQRVSWTVLLSAFGVFLAIVVGVPVGTFQWIRHATVPPVMQIQALEGTAQLEQTDNTSRLLLARSDPAEVGPGAALLNDAEAETLLTIGSPDGLYTLGTVLIYPNTQFAITDARSPRYASSNEDHFLELTVTTGRVRLTLARDAGHPLEFLLRTPHSTFALSEGGSYSLDVNNQQSQITVREGEAVIIAPLGGLNVEENKRGLVGIDGIPVGPLRPERNLIANGSFRQPLDQGWQIRTDTSDDTQPAGAVEILAVSGQNLVSLSRVGTGHAETGVYQLLNQSLNDYQSLQLHLGAQLDFQSLGVCGALGSECPLMVRIDYEDAAGNPRQWVQGFYYWIDPAAPNPLLCETCPPPRQEHEQHAQGTQFFYDSPNLIEFLSQDGSPPASITSLSVYASGHSYTVRVFDIELLVGE